MKLKKKHKHKWFIELEGIQFLQCECGEIKTVDFPKQRIYIEITEGSEG